MKVFIKKKAFGDKIVLENKTLEFPEGKASAILGPSGRGKTTLIRILAGLDKDYEGYIEDGGEKPVILFQEDRLVESISLLSNLSMVSEDKERMAYLISKLELKGEEKNRVSSFSGGMKRRAAIARALLVDSDVLFLDEPFKGLDEAIREETAALIRSECRGKTVIIITHDRIEAELLGVENYVRL